GGELREVARHVPQPFHALLVLRDAQELPHRLRVAERAVARRAADAVPLDEAIEAVAPVLRVEAPRELDRAERARVKAQPGALEFVAQESVVEARVVGDEHAA